MKNMFQKQIRRLTGQPWSLLNPFGKIDRVKMNPPIASPDLLEPAGPIDPTLSFIAVNGADGSPISVYAAYSLHYMGGTSSGHISADFYGVFSEELERTLEVPRSEFPFVAMLANGTSGDIGRVDHQKPQPPTAPYQGMRDVGVALAGKVKAAMDGVTWQAQTSLDARFRELPLRWRTIEPELLEWARQVEAKAPRLERGPVPMGARSATTPEYVVPLSYAGRIQALARATQPNRVPVQAVRIGDICIGSLPCETFAEIGLEFKQRSPFRHSFMVELNHGYLGYLPTPRHFELGGYETWPATNCFEPQASVVMLEEVLKMAAQLRAAGG